MELQQTSKSHQRNNYLFYLEKKRYDLIDNTIIKNALNISINTPYGTCIPLVLSLKLQCSSVILMMIL